MFFILSFIYKKERFLAILTAFIITFMILGVRLYFLQMKPSINVLSSYQNHQEENISSMKYKLYDTNGKDLMRYNKKYVLVIDVRPFTLNNYEENLKDLMSFNYIMKSEKADFNYIDIMKNKGKIYYDISEDTFNKISRLKNIKGIYTYTYDEADIKKAWSIGSFFSDVLDKEWPENSLFMTYLLILKIIRI